MTTLIAAPIPQPNPDGSELSPYSLKDALLHAIAGDTILLRGTFQERLILTQTYAADAPLTVAAHPDGATIDGGHTLPRHPSTGPAKTAPDGTTSNFNGLVQVSGKHIDLIGFNVINSLGRGINLDKAEDVGIDGVTVDWSRNSGIYADGCTDLSIIGSKVLHSGCYYRAMRNPNQYNWPGGISILRSVGIKVTGCEVGLNWGEGVIIWRGSHDAEVSDCAIADNMSTNAYLDRACDTQVLRNLIYCTGTVPNVPPAQGVCIRNESYPAPITPPASNILVANNIILNCSTNLVVGNSEIAGELVSDIDILFNTLVNGVAAGMLLRTRDVRKARVMGNYLYQPKGQPIDLDGAPTQYAISGNCIWLSGEGLFDPNAPVVYGEVDPANYAPRVAYTAGPFDGAPSVDYFGLERKVWSAGALEYVAGPVVVEPPIEPPTAEVVTLILEASMSPTEAAELRALLAGRVVTVRLG